jgi:hypothetical protein
LPPVPLPEPGLQIAEEPAPVITLTFKVVIRAYPYYLAAPRIFKLAGFIYADVLGVTFGVKTG